MRMKVSNICDMNILLLICVVAGLQHLSSALNGPEDIWHHESGATMIGNAPTTTRETKQALSVSKNAKQNKSSEPINSTEANMKLDETCNLGGISVRVAVSLQPPLVDCAQDLFGEWICNGSNIEVINVLERRLNFQAHWIVLAGGHVEQQVGASSPSGLLQHSARSTDTKSNLASNESGIIGLVASGRALMSANGIIKTEDRNLQANLILSEPFDSFRLHLLLSKSVRDHDHIFIKPFSSQAWLAILAAALFIVPAFYLINSSSSHYSLQDDKLLSRLSIWTCTRYFISLVKSGNCCIESRRSSATDSSLFEQEVDRMVSSGGLVDFLVPKVVNKKSELRQQRRLLWRQWIQERRRARRLGRSARRTGFSKMAYVAWYVVGSLANQGGETEDLPDANSTRILVAFWWLYLIVICSIHSGILTAILTFPKQNDFIQTLDDFLALHPSEKMKLTVDRRSEMAHLLAKPTNLYKSPLKALLKDQSTSSNSIIEVDFQRHRQRVLDEVHLGHSAHLEEKSAIDMIITQEYLDSRPLKCQFKASRFPVDVIPMSLALSNKLSPRCVSDINRILRDIMRTGLAQKWRRKYESPGNDCLYTVNIIAGDVAKIQVRHVVLAFWLLATGLTIGGLFLIIEIVWLLTADVEEDEEDGSSLADSSTLNSLAGIDNSSSSSSSSDEGDLRFGHHLRKRRVSARSLSSGLRFQKALKMTHHRNKRTAKTAPALPSVASPVELNAMIMDTDGESRITNNRPPDRKQRIAARAAGRRARRLKRTLDLVKRLHEGKIYSDLFVKVSGSVQVQARRASNALIGRLPTSLPIASNHQVKRIVSETHQQQHHRSIQSSQFPLRRRRAVRIAAIEHVGPQY